MKIKELKIDKPVDDNWGIPRSQMPQIQTNDYPAFLDYLDSHGVNFVKDTVPAHSLKPIQGEFSDKGVEKALAKRKLDKPCIVSSDGHIIDGHHRWLAALNTKQNVSVYRADIPAHDLLKLVNDFPKVYYKNIYTEDKLTKFVEPNFNSEWEEAERYPEFQKIGKAAWIKLAKKGKEFTIKSAKDINNTDAADPDSFKSLDPNKQRRALAQLEKGTIELPIVAVYSDGYKELIGGNTRLTAMMAQDGQATVWAFKVPDEVANLAENFADGKVKGKSRPGRVKRAGASCKGSVTDLRARAKKASGEKAKMYHWCANMKSGKKKKTEDVDVMEEILKESVESDNIISDEVRVLGKLFTKNGYEIRVVGGAVRDVALGKEPKDIDLATDATPTEMQAMFDKANLKHIPTGIEHGTISVIIDKEPYEITTLRADKETDGRHAEVEFVRSWEQDAERRDLTYNAMSMDMDGKIHDYFGGMDDLQDKVSRFVGDPTKRIQEDYLRILRYFRFQARLDKPKFDKEAIDAISKEAKGLKQISAERVWMEISKLLIAPSAIPVLKQMGETGVADVIGLDVSNANSVKFDNPIMNLAMLSDDVGIGAKWKMSNDNKTELAFYIAHKNKKLSQQDVEDMISDGAPATYLANVLKIQGQDPNWAKAQVPQFPVTGKDLINFGIKPGPNMGKMLDVLKQQWKKSRFTASKEDLLTTLKEALINPDPKLPNLKEPKKLSKYAKRKKVFSDDKDKPENEEPENSTDNIVEDLSANAELYVDMDGVLADFFGEWAKLIGVDSWRNIKNIEPALEKIRQQKDFWINLPMTSNALQLLSAIKAYKGKYNILSAPLPGDKNSEPQKRAWIKKNLSSFPPEKIIIDHNKAAYATQPDGTPNGLIDDFGQNVSKWEAAGGIAFKYNDLKIDRTISKLEKETSTPSYSINEDDVEVSMYGDAEKGYTLSKIVVPKELRGTGIGSKKMRELVDKADNEGAIIALTPDTTFGASSKGRLIKFYKGFGFVPNVGRNKDFRYRETMIRYPKSSGGKDSTQ